ncbi:MULTISPECIES: hydantoinase B/oxoprolinase family protein [unclassified Sphingomonas]|uniref:hydantoinase B/oxoprolinase family protein n=1 Tax=unclassified Sphingomonas TaxID=196159 RepID=UPI0006FB70CB|nr:MULTISPECIES: hydantoinase B/oxoprolinase family protein [unclassified Sphingomonas]KQX25969.1 hypothetical protein ASD17_00405 [Sphingomonas sp. Root1294]KQY69034.1 hypothetical protein ASD39_01600 [Sphingomonas sp. Root50]KRB89289.1 hypothetical protein ASE22_16515 [Sphingomonas sp. Root720]
MARQDPFTINIIQNSFQALCDQMSASLRRTAMSSVIYEALDFGVGLTDAAGDLVCDGAGIPMFVGILDHSVRTVIAKFGDDVHAGDLFLTNVPTGGGGTHLNDVVALQPVFAGERLAGWVVAKAHWTDIGGMVPGGISDKATEAFQEGLILPEIRLFNRGVLDHAVRDIIAANSRMPKFTLGDMWAMVAAVQLGADRLGETAGRYGADALALAMAEMIAIGERVTLAGLRKLPPGTYHAEDHMDDGRRLQCSVTITADRFVVDLRGNPEQSPTSHNSPYISSFVCAGLVLKAITDPQAVANSGCFRALTVLTDKGSMFDPLPGSACGMYVPPSLYVTELVWKAVADLAPDRMAAGHVGSINAISMLATHPERGTDVFLVVPEVGGYGAAHDADGQPASGIFGNGDARNSPAEICEARNGIRVDRYEFHDEPGGEGEFRGGRGVCVEYVVAAPDTLLASLTQTRSVYPPWGMKDGRDGSLNHAELVRADGKIETASRFAQVGLDPGDRVRIYTAHGAGYGDPRNRTAERVQADIDDGLITAERARIVYGYGA